MGKKKEAKPLLDKSKQIVKPVASTSSSGSFSTSGSTKKSGGKNKGGITKNPSTPTLQSVPESEPLGSTQSLPTTLGGGEPKEEEKACPMSYFGVKSYLHHFYEPPTPQDGAPNEDDYHYLIRPKGSQIGAYLFKIGLIVGSTLFLMGAVAIIIGYAIPKHVEIKEQTDEFKLVDRNAIQFNRNLDICKLIGLAGFCFGGLILVISLLAPTFASSYWDVEALEEPFRVPINSSPTPDDEPKSPIPVTEKIKCIQPNWAE